MTKRKNVLDVDFIGGQGKLTAAEEKLLSEYFQKATSKSTTKSKEKSKKKRVNKYVTV